MPVKGFGIDLIRGREQRGPMCVSQQLLSEPCGSIQQGPEGRQGSWLAGPIVTCKMTKPPLVEGE